MKIRNGVQMAQGTQAERSARQRIINSRGGSMKVKWLVVALIVAAVMLSVAPNGVATHNTIGRGEGWLDRFNPFDLWNAGFASDHLGDDLILVVAPSGNLDVKICFALHLFTTDGVFRRELSCKDRLGQGGTESLTKHISSSDFPNFTWRLNARLILEVWRFSGSGSYDLELRCC